MESTINGRIREFINYLDITDSAFAKKIGVTQSVIASMFLRGTEPSAKVISSILAVFDDISAEWLLRGKGEMLISANQSKDENTERISRLVDTIATLQGTINEQLKTIQALQEKERRLNGELAMLKNERNAK
ncbi:helix-turn-helix domain-containing protein [Bacteroides intestinalis]|jgi:predicted transcriptional regulator|uniref:helix-turn-helix domain-containing protein n=1 Tax=Bacteroides intestinalis TaxID=329854 RepID=UPI0015F5E9A5|nr:helix-turn-helix domain-containing protein [Bacteroides intestinalis]